MRAAPGSSHAARPSRAGCAGPNPLGKLFWPAGKYSNRNAIRTSRLPMLVGVAPPPPDLASHPAVPLHPSCDAGKPASSSCAAAQVRLWVSATRQHAKKHGIAPASNPPTCRTSIPQHAGAPPDTARRHPTAPWHSCRQPVPGCVPRLHSDCQCPGVSQWLHRKRCGQRRCAKASRASSCLPAVGLSQQQAELAPTCACCFKNKLASLYLSYSVGL